MFVSPCGIKVGSFLSTRGLGLGFNGRVRAGHRPEHPLHDTDLVLFGIVYDISDLG